MGVYCLRRLSYRQEVGSPATEPETSTGGGTSPPVDANCVDGLATTVAIVYDLKPLLF